MEASRIAGQESFYSPLFALALQLLQGTPSVEGKVDWNHLCSSDVANRTIQPHGVELASPEVRAVRHLRSPLLDLVRWASGWRMVS
jgi:hypothetical protein